MTTIQKHPNAYRDILKRVEAGKSIVAIGLPREAPGTAKLYPKTGVSVVEAAEKNRRRWKFMKNTTPEIIKVTKFWLRKMRGDIISGDVTKEQFLIRVASLSVGIIQEEIREIKNPRNSVATVKKKGENNPLVDTGTLGQSITFVLRD